MEQWHRFSTRIMQVEQGIIDDSRKAFRESEQVLLPTLGGMSPSTIATSAAGIVMQSVLNVGTQFVQDTLPLWSSAVSQAVLHLRLPKNEGLLLDAIAKVNPLLEEPVDQSKLDPLWLHLVTAAGIGAMTYGRTPQGLWNELQRSVTYSTYGSTLTNVTQAVQNAWGEPIDVQNRAMLTAARDSLQKSMGFAEKGVARAVSTQLYSTVNVVSKRASQLTGGAQLVWSAILDDRTCLRCANLDGTLFSDNDSAPSPPLHNFCRCLLIPTDGRESVRYKSSFLDFFRLQSPEFQESVLGLNHAVWKRGDLVFRDAVEMRAKVPIVTRRLKSD